MPSNVAKQNKLKNRKSKHTTTERLARTQTSPQYAMQQEAEHYLVMYDILNTRDMQRDERMDDNKKRLSSPRTKLKRESAARKSLRPHCASHGKRCKRQVCHTRVCIFYCSRSCQPSNNIFKIWLAPIGVDFGVHPDDKYGQNCNDYNRHWKPKREGRRRNSNEW